MTWISASKGRPQAQHAGASIIELNDGRRFGYQRYGVPRGRTVIALHGTPGSRLKFSATDKPAHDLGMTILAVDRWGYGSTDRHPTPSLTAFAADLAGFADRLNIEQFDVLGVSGGGPYAVAAAAAMPNRVRSLALFAPVGPIAGRPDMPMSPFHRFCFGWFANDRIAPTATFRAFRRLILINPRFGLAVAMARIPAADRDVLKSPGVAERLAETFVEGLRPGAHGPATDLAIFGKAWNIPLPSAIAPARIWIGSDDRNVPIAAARSLAACLPNCKFVEVPAAGHLWAALHYATILAWIAETPHHVG